MGTERCHKPAEYRTAPICRVALERELFNRYARAWGQVSEEVPRGNLNLRDSRGKGKADCVREPEPRLARKLTERCRRNPPPSISLPWQCDTVTHDETKPPITLSPPAPFPCTMAHWRRKKIIYPSFSPYGTTVQWQPKGGAKGTCRERWVNRRGRWAKAEEGRNEECKVRTRMLAW